MRSPRTTPSTTLGGRGARAIGVTAMLAAAVAAALLSGLPAAAQESGGIGVEEYFRVFPPHRPTCGRRSRARPWS